MFQGHFRFIFRFHLVQETKRGNFVWLDSKNNQPIKTQTKWICEDTNTPLLDSQIKYSYYYGGERIIFEKEELNNIKTLESKPGLQLMGFKPQSSLKIHHNIKNAGFIYPDEQVNKMESSIFLKIIAYQRKYLSFCYSS